MHFNTTIAIGLNAEQVAKKKFFLVKVKYQKQTKL